MRADWKPNFFDASWSIVEVMKGGAGDFCLTAFLTLPTVKS